MKTSLSPESTTEFCSYGFTVLTKEIKSFAMPENSFTFFLTGYAIVGGVNSLTISPNGYKKVQL